MIQYIKHLYAVSLFVLMVPFVWGQETVTDIDGNVYETVVIGNQLWMAENLKVTHYSNGDEIPTGFSDEEWYSNDSWLTTGAYAIFENNSSIAEIYGNLYNWYAVDDERGLCPENFHVPSDDEWKELEMFLGMSQEEVDGIDL